MKSPSEFRADASFCRPISVYRHVVEVAIDTLYSSMHVQPEFYLPVFSRLPGPYLEFSCQYFPSLVERREPCRCKWVSRRCRDFTLFHLPAFVACTIRTWSRRTFW